MYTGREYGMAGGLGLTYNVARKLTSNYILRNHHLYTDNFFSSVTLIRDLHEADTYYCGVIRKNSRGLPEYISQIRLQRGDSEILSTYGDIMFCRWFDKRDVFVMATNTDGGDTAKPRNRFIPKGLLTVPKMITDYSHHMDGIDHIDQFRA